MKDYIIKALLKFSQQESVTSYLRLLILAISFIIFLSILPIILIYLDKIISENIRVSWPSYLEISVIIISIPFGLFFLIWSTISQWRVGGGTPSPLVPTQKLVIVGPYKLCRNPIELGAIFFFLGIGTLLGSLTTGLIVFLFLLIVLSAYHKSIEEEELLLRYGHDYEKYREKTPFLIPRIRLDR